MSQIENSVSSINLKDKRVLLEDIQNKLQKSSSEITSISVLEGKSDEVFRELTNGDL